MNLPPPPPFHKTNQHIVPRFWQKGFAAPTGHVYARSRIPGQSGALGPARQANVAGLMTSDWTYTVFDQWWRPSDEVENRLATIEGHHSKAIQSLLARSTIDLDLTWALCQFVGLAVSRTPEAMARGHRRLKELARAYSTIHQAASFSAFRDDIQTKFGVLLTQRDYDDLRSRPKDDLLKTADGIDRMSPQDPLLPEQIALKGADVIAFQIGEMELTLLDASGADNFILGDTPLPDFDLAKGFTLPLSKSLVLKAVPRTGAFQLPARHPATSHDVLMMNQEQFDRSVNTTIIGPDPAALNALV